MNLTRSTLRGGALLVLLLGHLKPAYAGWTAATFLGVAHTQPSTLAVTLPGEHTDVLFDPVAYRGESFTLPLYYGYRIGYLFPAARWLSLEGELIHLKVFAETDRLTSVTGRQNGSPILRTERLDQTVQRFSISHGMNLLLINAVLRRQIAPAGVLARLVLTARAGAGPTIPHAESTIAGDSQEQYELGRLGVQGAAGFELAIDRRWYGLAEYKITRTQQTVTVTRGEARTALTTHHLAFGVGYRF